MSFRLGFRAKLLLSIFPVVAGITLAVLWIAERKFSNTQQRLFEEQFEGQISALIKHRQDRSDTIGRDLIELANDPDLVKAVSDGKAHEAWTILKPNLEKMALDAVVPQRWAQDGSRGSMLLPNGPARFSNGLRLGERDKLAGGGSRYEPKQGRLPPGLAPFLGMVDAKGEFLLSQRGKQNGGKLSADEQELKRRSGRLRWLAGRDLADVLEHQETGYLLVEDEEGKAAHVREIFVTPLRGAKREEFYGAFVFGLPLTSADERSLYERSKQSDLGRIMSGIWVEDTLVSNTLPASQREMLAKLVAAELAKSDRPSRELSVNIDGVRHRVMFRILNPGSPFPIAAQVSLYSMAVLDAEIADLRRSVVGLGALALVVALGLAIVVSRGLSGPVHELVRGTTEIERGNFDFRVKVASRDEMGVLADSFNQMAAGLALQEKYRSVLNAVADRTVARELMASSTALGGELRDVSVLFCDIRGFTAITEGMPPREVIDMLNEHMTALTDVAYQHGGIVDKFVGDLLMVLFGAPTSSGNDAASAVHCACDMLARRRELNETSAHPLEIGIGIATGTVVAGCMGSERRLNYTVLGEKVNLGARLCGQALAGEVVIDQATFEATRHLIQSTPRPPMRLKGFAEPVASYLVAALIAADDLKEQGEPAATYAEASAPL